MTEVLRLVNVSLEYPLPRRYRKQNITPSGVRDISLKIKQGEVVGIIGKNGSGKSTILKMMAGVFPPEHGEISLKGSVSLLAGVGVGFHQELTGRENSYLYGALMGRKKNQIDELIDEIQAFSELQHHFDRPIRTYSSGMKSRLGISVATSFKPDILLIDEVLGVGDASFRKKSEERVMTMMETSGTVIIVSHSMSMMKQICSRIILVESGEIIFDGAPSEGIDLYLKEFQ